MLGRVGTGYRQHLPHLPSFRPTKCIRTSPTFSLQLRLASWAASHAFAVPPADPEDVDRDVVKEFLPEVSRHAQGGGGRGRRGGKPEGPSPTWSKAGQSSGHGTADSVSPRLISLLDTFPKQGTDLATLKNDPALQRFHCVPDELRIAAAHLATSPQPQRALHLITVAHSMGVPTKPNVYENVAHGLANSRRWKLLISLVDLAKHHMGRTSSRLLNWKIRACTELGHYSKLERLLDQFHSEGLKPTRRTFHSIITAHLRNHDVLKAKACMQEMEAAGYPVDASTHAQVIAVYRELGPDTFVADHAFQALRDIGEDAATRTLNSLMQMSLDAGDVAGAFRLLALFRRQDTPDLPGHMPSDGTRAHSEIEVVSTRLVSGKLQASHGPLPDTATFTTIVDHLSQLGDLPRSLRTVKKMIASGIEPDTRIAAALIRAHYSTDDVAGAVKIVANACTECSIPYEFFVRLGAPQQLLEEDCLFPLIKRPDIWILNAFMEGALSTSGLNGMVVVLRIMRLCGVAPDSSSLEILLSHLHRIERARPRELMRVLRALLSGGCRPTLQHYHIILAAVMREERFNVLGRGWNKLAVRFSPSRQDFTTTSEDRISTTDESFHPRAGLRFSRKLSYRSLIRPVLDSLSARKVRVDRATMAMRIRHDAVIKGDLESAREQFQNMLATGMHPNEYHFAALMEGSALAGDVDAALSAMSSAERLGIPPNVKLYTIIIAGWARAGQPEKASHAFRRMIAAGIRPDVGSVDALCSAYFAVGAYGTARRVLLELWPYVRPLPNHAHGLRLQALAHLFRSSDETRDQLRSSTVRLTKQERRVLRWKLRHVVHEWRRLRTVLAGDCAKRKLNGAFHRRRTAITAGMGRGDKNVESLLSDHP